MQHKFRLGDIQPNPFRNIAAYPIDRAKVEALKASFANTSVWPVIVARVRPAAITSPEIAFGHHRLAAAKEAYGDDYEIVLNIESLSDDEMLKMMANENMTEYKATIDVLAETVKTTRDYLIATGRAKERKVVSSGAGHIATEGGVAKAVAEFLGWTPFKVSDVLTYLNAEEEGIVTLADVTGMGYKKALSARTLVEKTVKQYIAPDAPEEVKSAVRRDVYTTIRKGDVDPRRATTAQQTPGGAVNPVYAAVAKHAGKPGVKVYPTPAKATIEVEAESLIRGIASEMGQIAIALKRLNDLLIAHPAVAVPARQVLDSVGKGVMAQAIIALDPELNLARAVFVHGKPPVARPVALPSGTAPAGTKVVSP